MSAISTYSPVMRFAPKSRVYLAYNLGDTAAERAEKLRFKVAYLLSY